MVAGEVDMTGESCISICACSRASVILLGRLKFQPCLWRVVVQTLQTSLAVCQMDGVSLCSGLLLRVAPLVHPPFPRCPITPILLPSVVPVADTLRPLYLCHGYMRRFFMSSRHRLPRPS